MHINLYQDKFLRNNEQMHKHLFLAKVNTAVKRLRMCELPFEEKFHNMENARVRKIFYYIFG